MQNDFPIAIFIGTAGGLIAGCAVGGYQLVTGMSQTAKDTVGILLVTLPAAVLLIGVVIYMMQRRPQRQPRPSEHSNAGQDWATGDSAAPYHIQYPHPSAKGLPAPQYDETLIYNPPQTATARQWAIVDEVKQ